MKHFKHFWNQYRIHFTDIIFIKINTVICFWFYFNDFEIITEYFSGLKIKSILTALKQKVQLTFWFLFRKTKWIDIVIGDSLLSIWFFQFRLSWKTIFQNFWFPPKWLSHPSCVMSPIMQNLYYLLLFTIEHDGMTGMTGKLETFVKNVKKWKIDHFVFPFYPILKTFWKWRVMPSCVIIYLVQTLWNHHRRHF
jgi:hypothetical protein